MPNIKKTIHLILDNIRSVHNVGSIFRTADCAGVSMIHGIGTTPVPVDRFGRKRKDFAKVSLGAEESVGWEHVEETATRKLLKRLKDEGFEIVAIEQAKGSTDITKLRMQSKSWNKVAYILGNEVEGVSSKLLKLADMIVEIQMKGEKESLNVSVAAGVVLFGLMSDD